MRRVAQAALGAAERSDDASAGACARRGLDAPWTTISAAPRRCRAPSAAAAAASGAEARRSAPVTVSGCSAVAEAPELSVAVSATTWRPRMGEGDRQPRVLDVELLAVDGPREVHELPVGVARAVAVERHGLAGGRRGGRVR